MGQRCVSRSHSIGWIFRSRGFFCDHGPTTSGPCGCCAQRIFGCATATPALSISRRCVFLTDDLFDSSARSGVAVHASHIKGRVQALVLLVYLLDVVEPAAAEVGEKRVCEFQRETRAEPKGHVAIVRR